MCLPQLEKDHTHLPSWLLPSLWWEKVALFYLSIYFHLTWEDSIVLMIKQLAPPASPTLDVRRPLRKTFIYLVPSLIYLPPPRLSAWLAAELTDCLDGWLPLSLDAHFTHTLRELRWGWSGERQSSLLRLWGSGISLLNFSPFLFWWIIRWEQRNKSGSLALLQHWPLTITTVCCIHDFTYLAGVRAWIYLGLGTLLDTGWVGCAERKGLFAMHGDIWKGCMCVHVCACVHVCVCACVCECVCTCM